MKVTSFALRRFAFTFCVAALGARAVLPAISLAQARGPEPAAEISEQQRLRAQSPGGGLTPGVELPSWSGTENRLRRGSPVTDELLTNPLGWITRELTRIRAACEAAV